jgi:hypothetical protein
VGIKESHAPSQGQSRSLEVLIAVTALAPMLIVGAEREERQDVYYRI